MSRKLFFGVSFALVLGLAASTAVADLVAYYPLDEGSGDTATDASGNGHNGTLNGDPRWIAGKFGQALEFPGRPEQAFRGRVDLPTVFQQDRRMLSRNA